MARTMPGPATRRVVALLACTALLAAACAPDDRDGQTSGMSGDDTAMDRDMAGDGMQDMDGDMAMGDMAEITVASEAQVSSLPPEPVGWVGYRFDRPGGGGATYSWGPAFLYADEEARTLDIDGMETTLEPGDAVFVEQGVEHSVADGSFWAFVLTDPEADPAPGLEAGSREMSSGPLEGLPDVPVDLRFLIVDLPPQEGRTAVHTHPGPEFVYVAQGEIQYETGLEETTVLTAGDASALPAETAVQKRNVTGGPARFWSWFIVDPGEPFSAEATFGRE